MPATNIRAALSQQRRTQQQGSWWNIIKSTVSEWVDDDAMTWAAAIACYTLLALAPLLVIAVLIATVMLGGQEQAVQKIESEARGWMGPDAARAIAPIIGRNMHRGNGVLALSVSIILVVLSVGGVFAELQQAMNRIWKVKPRPGTALMTFVRARLTSLFVIVIAVIVLVISVLVTAWLQHTSTAIGLHWKGWAIVVNSVVSLAVLVLLFALIYRTVPDAEIKWRSTVIGAIISAILFEVGKYGLAFYFKLAAPSSAYGAAGSLAAVLIWIYYSAQIVFFGAEFTQVYAKARGDGVQPSKHAQFFSTCDETETATPSNEPPDRKPTRAGAPSGDDSHADYTSVLSWGLETTNSSATATSLSNGERVLLRNLLAAGAGLAVGATIGGLGAVRATRSKPPAGTRDAARLDERLKQIERKLQSVSQIKRRIAEQSVDERIDEVVKRFGRLRVMQKHPDPDQTVRVGSKGRFRRCIQ